MMVPKGNSSRNSLARRGTVVMLTVFLLSAIFAFVAFSVDVGYIVHTRTELQRTADCSALAAVARMPNQSDATQAAETGIDANRGTVGPDKNASDIEYGYWNRDTAQFVTPVSYPQQANAVRVTVNRTEAEGNALRLFFAHIIGVDKGDVTASAIAMVDRNLCGPFVGIDWVSVPGSVETDSYNTNDGMYNAGSAGDRGSLCSDGPITLEGNSYIRGDARAGKGHTVSMYGTPVVTGSIGSRRKPLNMPPVDTSAVASSNDNNLVPPVRVGNSWVSPLDGNRNLVLDGNRSLTLPEGTYYFNDVILSGQAELHFSGNTTIYMTGDLSRAGGVTVNNNTQIPGNLEILMTGGTANITSYDPFHGVIYAPNTDIIIDGSSDFFGAVVGKTLTITGNAEGHYDEALGDLNGEYPMRTALVD